MPVPTITTLCLVRANSQILLGYKKRGFGANRWNGFGGKLGEGETVLEAAHRELVEECGIVGKNFREAGLMRFHIAHEKLEIEVHLFEVSDFEGEPVETEEMRPQWFYENELPFDQMWPDDRFWFPYFLERRKFNAEFFFKDTNQLIDYKITEANGQ